MQKFINGCENEISKLDNEMEDIHNRIYMLEEYCDKYVPMKIQTAIGNTITPILSPKKKKMVKTMLSDKMQELKQNVATGKQCFYEF